MLGGIEQFYPDKLHAPLQVIGVDPTPRRSRGIFMMVFEKNVYFLADTTVNIDPDAAHARAHRVGDRATGEAARRHAAGRHAVLLELRRGTLPATEKVAEAVRLLQASEPDLEVDGEMQAETALEEKLLKGSYPFSRLHGPGQRADLPEPERRQHRATSC